MDLKEIKAVIDLMTRHGLSEFELERADFKIRIKRAPGGEWVTSATPAVPSAAPAPVSLAVVPALPTTPLKEGQTTPAVAPIKHIFSPMVGTFYSAPTPESPSYVKVGDEVKEDTVVCIIEAMKVMNEIKAEIAGVIVEVLVQNGRPVEFDKPLFSVRSL
jgi:acetyl-CoA carboxylase biotin carboxyl carrier protein